MIVLIAVALKFVLYKWTHLFSNFLLLCYKLNHREKLESFTENTKIFSSSFSLFPLLTCHKIRVLCC